MTEMPDWAVKDVEHIVNVLLKKYVIPSAHRDDLIQEGQIGYWEAAQRFDESLGVKLRTFANPRIRGRVLDYIRGFVTPFSRTHYREMKDSGNVPNTFSLDTTLQEMCRNADQDVPLKDILPSPHLTRDRLSLDDFWLVATKGLNAKERHLVLRYFRDGLTLRVVGEELGLSESLMSQCRSQVLEFLKAHRRELPEYLPDAK